MQQHSTKYTVVFAAGVCVVCSVFVAGSAVALKQRQEENKLLDRQTKVLSVAGLIGEGQELSREAVAETFESYVQPSVIELSSGASTDIEPDTFDQKAAAADPATSSDAPDNSAKVRRLPNNALVYEVQKDGKLEALIFPVEGKGLWSTLYGFLALEADANTVKGITFYEHGETPGLGGEVDNPRWKALWPGRKVFDSAGAPKLGVKKGAAGSPEADPYQVDGLSGATITSRGVTSLVQFWMGENGYGPYLDRYRKEKGI